MAKRRDSDDSALTHLAAKTPWPTIALIVSAISAPLTFFTDRGLTFTLFLFTVAATIWWFDRYLRPRMPREAVRRNGPPSWAQTVASGVMLFALMVSFVIAAYLNFSGLNIFRANYSSEFLPIETQTTAFKHFGSRPHDASYRQDDEFDRNRWIRWMTDSADSSNGYSLTFIASKPFKNNFHDFEVEVHDLSKRLRPKEGIAFLVFDAPDDAWHRPTYRQLRCIVSGDAETRLFRIPVPASNRHEKLYLFLKLESAVPNQEPPSPESLPFVLRVTS